MLTKEWFFVIATIVMTTDTDPINEIVAHTLGPNLWLLQILLMRVSLMHSFKGLQKYPPYDIFYYSREQIPTLMRFIIYFGC